MVEMGRVLFCYLGVDEMLSLKWVLALESEDMDGIYLAQNKEQ